MSFLRDSIFNQNFEMHYVKGKLNIINYTKIEWMEKEKISLEKVDGTILITGQNLRVQKLLDHEILLDGTIQAIEWKSPDA